TASDGRRRFLFGWNATRQEERDDRPWQWGGSLVVHEIIQEADGALSVRAPASIDQSFQQASPAQFQPGLGDCRISPEGMWIEAPDSFGCASAGPLPDRCKIEARIEFGENTRGCGVMLRVS